MAFLDDILKKVATLIERLSQEQIRGAVTRAIRPALETRGEGEPRKVQTNSGFGVCILENLADLKGVPRLDNECRTAFCWTGHYPELRPLHEALWWTVQCGLLVPVTFHEAAGLCGLHVTDAGMAAINHLDDFPLAPGFVRRLVKRCSDLPDGTIAALEDAHQCHQAGLLRPAVNMIGLAYESAVEAILERFVKESWLQKVPFSAKDRVDALVKRASGLAMDDHQRRGVRFALEYVEHLRERRNDASHPKARYPLDDRGEIEELLLSAGRRLPDLWVLMSAKTP